MRGADKIMSSSPLLAMEGVTLRLFGRDLLPDTNWTLCHGENWVVTGPNGAGKSTLMRALSGEVPIPKGRIQRFHQSPPSRTFSHVSFETQKKLMAKEALLDEARDFAGKAYGSSVTDLTYDLKTDLLPEIFRKTLLPPVENRTLANLSTGEIRKLVIARALCASPSVLILDEPFDGLDAASKENLKKALTLLAATPLTLILVTHRITEIPEGFTNHLVISENRVQKADRKMVFRNGNAPYHGPIPQTVAPGHKTPLGETMIAMENVTVSYGETMVFQNLSWTVKKGEHWLITGPNGAGKSTLMGLVTGRNLQCYANPITLFGKKRGSGESLWEIRKRLGSVSAAEHLDSVRMLTAKEVVVSGFFDTTALSARPLPDQWEAALRWLSYLRLLPLAQKRFDHLSYGQQRMLLIARAMVKSPDLLLLDEPCQGLDPFNRQQVTDLLQRIMKESAVTLIYITHHTENRPTGFTHHLCFAGNHQEILAMSASPVSKEP